MSASYYAQVLLSFGFISCLLFLTYKGLKMYKNKSGKSNIKIIDRCPIDNHSSLYIVNVRGNDLLISSNQKSCYLLKELDQEKINNKDASLASHIK